MTVCPHSDNCPHVGWVARKIASDELPHVWCDADDFTMDLPLDRAESAFNAHRATAPCETCRADKPSLHALPGTGVSNRRQPRRSPFRRLASVASTEMPPAS